LRIRFSRKQSLLYRIDCESEPETFIKHLYKVTEEIQLPSKTSLIWLIWRSHLQTWHKVYSELYKASPCNKNWYNGNCYQSKQWAHQIAHLNCLSDVIIVTTLFKFNGDWTNLNSIIKKSKKLKRPVIIIVGKG
jgi:hypothetical protein